MNRNLFPIVLVFCLLVSFFSCSNKSNKRPRKPVSTISIKPAKQLYTSGDKVTLNIKTRLRDGELKSVKVYYEGKLLQESDELKFEIPDVELDRVGNTSFKVNAEKTDGLNNSRVKTINVLSEIAPKQLTYQVEVKYPHLKTSYTQGLEYYKGYLYEGTGEEGHSKLMKVDIKTGEPVQSIDLEDKYFGEGITILNDKIYQLTYRAKKGFVYDLETFAVIDSFTYKSPQGWGLTNDGTNLIMSDGTNILTWLNPDDFSIVKTVQVANNRGNMNVLNEMEYIDGIIYANIYTTNYIVKIDAKTGKVLEEINMEGLIDMYHRSNDRIDVLNGIAYDAKNDRFFVTGKLWPMLFEVKFIEK
ncbi:glutaminyl-peptide cyclotransferase [Draconibacterium halophilum]|uniref:Glutaminyl-peptide cyclotransferase n=1 Tax=Draconibacterium halophilum TaxID=2706887 RepID=A0A6C0R8M2_9BACT|nr:glutaminyl-peptide cyclotransferase [Draconibacterium halophilum]QIA06529.1 glutaminyl-peptide cyclotransferase [Draconibacterium halophilum]